MRASEFITEAPSTNLLIVDVQPEYSNYSNRILTGVRNMISKATGKIIIVYNDFGGGDTEQDVFHYLAGIHEDDMYDYDEENDEYVERVLTPFEQKVQSAQYIQKEFGFLRGFMDNDISDHTIIEVIRYMYNNRINDSRDIEIEHLSENAQEELENTSESIFIQDWVSIKLLKSISPFYMMGGGRTECLREIELLCNAFNIRYKRIDSLIYG